MTKINLEEILNKVIGIETKSDSFKLAILEAMKEACNQTVDEAVKRCASKVTHTAGQWYSDYSCMKWNVEKVAEQLKKELE